MSVPVDFGTQLSLVGAALLNGTYTYQARATGGTPTTNTWLNINDATNLVLSVQAVLASAAAIASMEVQVRVSYGGVSADSSILLTKLDGTQINVLEITVATAVPGTYKTAVGTSNAQMLLVQFGGKATGAAGGVGDSLTVSVKAKA